MRTSSSSSHMGPFVLHVARNSQALGITPGGGDNGNIAALLSQKPPEELAAEREAKRKRWVAEE
jgi:hypothetical protein